MWVKKLLSLWPPLFSSFSLCRCWQFQVLVSTSVGTSPSAGCEDIWVSECSRSEAFHCFDPLIQNIGRKNNSVRIWNFELWLNTRLRSSVSPLLWFRDLGLTWLSSEPKQKPVRTDDVTEDEFVFILFIVRRHLTHGLTLLCVQSKHTHQASMWNHRATVFSLCFEYLTLMKLALCISFIFSPVWSTQHLIKLNYQKDDVQ